MTGVVFVIFLGEFVDSIFGIWFNKNYKKWIDWLVKKYTNNELWQKGIIYQPSDLQPHIQAEPIQPDFDKSHSRIVYDRSIREIINKSNCLNPINVNVKQIGLIVVYLTSSCVNWTLYGMSGPVWNASETLSATDNRCFN
jgi:hypothetical protein